MTPAESKELRKIKERKRRVADIQAVLGRERKQEIARHDLAIGLSSLFRVLKKGAKRKHIEIKQRHGTDDVVIAGPELDVADQDVLFGLLALALQQDLIPSIDDKNSLQAQSWGLPPETLEVKTTTSELLYIMGRNKGGKQLASIRRSIRYLCSVVVESHKSDGSWGTTNLVGGAAGRGDGICVRLSYRITMALMAQGVKGSGLQYAAISWQERRQLSPTARLLHAWLCSWLPVGTCRKIKHSSLMKHIYGVEDVVTRSGQSKRRKEITGALQEIRRLPGWGGMELPVYN